MIAVVSCGYDIRPMLNSAGWPSPTTPHHVEWWPAVDSDAHLHPISIDNPWSANEGATSWTKLPNSCLARPQDTGTASKALAKETCGWSSANRFWCQAGRAFWARTSVSA